MPQSEADVDNVDQIFAWQKMQRQLSKRLKDVLPKKDFMDRYGKEEGVRMEKKRENGFDTHTTHVCRNHKYRQQSAHRNILSVNPPDPSRHSGAGRPGVRDHPRAERAGGRGGRPEGEGKAGRAHGRPAQLSQRSFRNRLNHCHLHHFQHL